MATTSAIVAVVVLCMLSIEARFMSRPTAAEPVMPRVSPSGALGRAASTAWTIRSTASRDCLAMYVPFSRTTMRVAWSLPSCDVPISRGPITRARWSSTWRIPRSGSFAWTSEPNEAERRSTKA